MRCDSAFKDPKDAELILEKLSGLTRAAGSVRLMEVCGTHTMSIARTGLKSLLPPEIALSASPLQGRWTRFFLWPKIPAF